jgi:hypothetical protein
MNANEPVVLCTTTNPSEAEFLKNLLEGEGVKSDLDGMNQGSLAGILDIRILVRAWDKERATKVLASHSPHHRERSWEDRGD